MLRNKVCSSSILLSKYIQIRSIVPRSLSHFVFHFSSQTGLRALGTAQVTPAGWPLSTHTKITILTSNFNFCVITKRNVSINSKQLVCRPSMWKQRNDLKEHYHQQTIELNTERPFIVWQTLRLVQTAISSFRI